MKDIYIFTIVRAGSTWLTEIINSQPGIKTVSEPLSTNNKDQISVLTKYFGSMFLEERYISLTDREKELMVKYFSDLSLGKTLRSLYWRDLFSRSHSFFTNRTLFKTHKISSLLLFFDDKFDIDIIYLIRHPISNSISRIRKGWNHYIKHYLDDEYFRGLLDGNLINFIEKINMEGTILEKFVASWCLENWVFLRTLQKQEVFKNNITLVTYEELVLQPEKVIKKLYLNLNLTELHRMFKHVNIPSHGIIHSTKQTKENIIAGNRDYLLNRWKKDVSNNEEKKVFNILEKFNIDLYTFGNHFPNEIYSEISRW